MCLHICCCPAPLLPVIPSFQQPTLLLTNHVAADRLWCLGGDTVKDAGPGHLVPGHAQVCRAGTLCGRRSHRSDAGRHLFAGRDPVGYLDPSRATRRRLGRRCGHAHEGSRVVAPGRPHRGMSSLFHFFVFLGEKKGVLSSFVSQLSWPGNAAGWSRFNGLDHPTPFPSSLSRYCQDFELGSGPDGDDKLVLSEEARALIMAMVSVEPDLRPPPLRRALCRRCAAASLSSPQPQPWSLPYSNS